MKELSFKNSNIAHLGRNFWRKLVADCPTYNFKSDNCFLLFIDDDGRLLDCLLLTDGKKSCTDVMQACTTLERFFEATALVRLQTQPAYTKDPLGRHSLQTEALYTIADLYNLHLAEVVLPRFS